MKEAYDLADKNDTEGYNSVKAMCGDVQTLLQRQWVSLTDDEILDIVGRAGAGYPAAEQCGLWKALDEWSGEFGNGDVEQDGKPMLNDFVEAIIKECARFADEYVSESFGVHRDVGDEMKKHFGIGEKNDTDTRRNV